MQNILQVECYGDADFASSDTTLIHRIDEYFALNEKKIGQGFLIIDIGCGPGNICELLALKWPSARVIGIDGSQSMLALARSRKEQKTRDCLKNLSYYNLDISEISRLGVLPMPADLIVSNSCLHHLHDPSRFWAAAKMLSAHGSIHFHKDLRRPLSVNHAKSLQEKHLPKAPPVLKNDFLASLNAAFTKKEIELQLQNEGMQNLEVFELDDRYVEIVGVFRDDS